MPSVSVLSRQHCQINFLRCCTSALSSTVVTSYMWLLSTLNVVSATEELNFKFYLLLINLNFDLNSHVQLVASHTGQHSFIIFCTSLLEVHISKLGITVEFDKFTASLGKGMGQVRTRVLGVVRVHQDHRHKYRFIYSFQFGFYRALPRGYLRI